MNDINTIFMTELVPASIGRDKQVTQICTVLDKEIKKLNDAFESLYILPKIDFLDEQLIDLLAKQFDAPYYDSSLDLSIKRNLVKNAINWHKKKGTRSVIEEVLQIVYGSGEIAEWYEYDGEPYYFKVLLQQRQSFDEQTYKKLVSLINKVKNVRSWLERIELNISLEHSIYMGAALGCCYAKIELLSSQVSNLNFDNEVYMHKRLSSYNKMNLHPKNIGKMNLSSYTRLQSNLSLYKKDVQNPIYKRMELI